MTHIATLIVALVLAFAHLIVSRLRFLDGPRGHLWQSMAGGAAVSYVIVYILPSLAQQKELLEETAWVAFFARERVYLLCLLGFLVYYGIRRLGTLPGFGKGGRSWAMLIGFSVYSAIIGYLVGEQKDFDFAFLFLIAVAMSLHIIGTDHESRRNDSVFFDKYARWSLAASVFLGWLMGVGHLFGHSSIAAWKAFLSGAVIINTMWEEVPDERRGRFWPFAAGAIGFALLVLVVYRIR
jgi:hypothetical protein